MVVYGRSGSDWCERESCAFVTSHVCAVILTGVFALYEMGLAFLLA